MLLLLLFLFTTISSCEFPLLREALGLEVGLGLGLEIGLGLELGIGLGVRMLGDRIKP
jgi:hypothetical protein